MKTKRKIVVRIIPAPYRQPREAIEDLYLREDYGPNLQATSRTRVNGIPRRQEPLTDG